VIWSLRNRQVNLCHLTLFISLAFFLAHGHRHYLKLASISAVSRLGTCLVLRLVSLEDNAKRPPQLQSCLGCAGESYFTGVAHNHQVFVGLDHPYGAFAGGQTDHFGILVVGPGIQDDT
jgi:hypothetical protein